MCQIIVSKSFNLTSAMLKSLHQRNSDGLGCLVQGDHAPRRVLPRNFRDTLRFYKEHMHGKAGVAHWRMRTDGDITIDRVHPYEVVPGKLWLLHNGVLSGYRSARDEKESDTQKYINAILYPILKSNLRLWKNEAFLEMVSDHIGSNNRFVFADNKGAVRIVNRDAGFDVGDEWYSNTYSFDARRFFPGLFAPPPPPPGNPAIQKTAHAKAELGARYGSTQFSSGNPYGHMWTQDLPEDWRKQLDVLSPSALREVADSEKPLTVEELLTLVVHDVRDRPALRISMENLRKMDAQEYYGILQEAKRLAGGRTRLSHLEAEGMLDVINDTLMSYRL